MKNILHIPPWCISCNNELQNALYNNTFLPNLFKMVSGFLVLTVIVASLAYIAFKNHKRYQTTNGDKQVPNPVPLSITLVILGIGIGGFVDGILMHQILQWHGMFTNILPANTLLGKSVNMFWDGIFHLLTLTAVSIGVIALVRLLQKTTINTSTNLAWGGFFFGWGLFNTVEGALHHHILKFHNVREITSNSDLWNYGFLVSGLVFMILGFLILRRNYYPKK